jgi:hypothetical protein
MNRQQIEVVIAPDGSATIHVTGVKGKGCTDLTAELEKALGKVQGRKATAEAREKPLKVQRCARH